MFQLRLTREGQEQVLEVASVLIGTVQTQRDCNVLARNYYDWRVKVLRVATRTTKEDN
jgi:hypothetical protein